jgi:hypothetical protein
VKCEVTIELDLKQIDCGGGEQVGVVQELVQWWILVSAVLNLQNLISESNVSKISK